jgi:NAD(P)-dependent dehydrogenase (short-subunit alcohol dehydrogenase family)
MPSTQAKLPLKDKVALILGASTPAGIGAATARRFVADGARVVVSARRREALDAIATELGATAMTCDVTDEAQVVALVQAAFGLHSRLDVVVIVAGGYASQPIDQLTRETLLSNFELNVIAPAMTIKHAARLMSPGGSIVYVSSAAAELSSVGVAPYGCTKAAGERLVEVAALEYAARGIRLNIVQPGMLDTAMSSAALKRSGVRQAFERETALGRLATVEEVAAAAAWLASDECYTTGDRVRVAGGVHLRRHPMPDDFRSG